MRPPATRRLALLSLLSSVCLAVQISPRPFPNVELTSLLVFLVGAFFGVFVGGALGAAVMFINGFLSHWGFAELMLPFQMAGMVIIGVAGGLYGGTKKGIYTQASCVETAVLGAFLTLVYDVVTNIGFAMSIMLSGTPMLPAVVTTLVAGAPFSVIHVVSNTCVFMVAFFPLTRALQQCTGGENAWRNESSSM